jgi:hypothetical protein
MVEPGGSDPLNAAETSAQYRGWRRKQPVAGPSLSPAIIRHLAGMEATDCVMKCRRAGTNTINSNSWIVRCPSYPVRTSNHVGNCRKCRAPARRIMLRWSGGYSGRSGAIVVQSTAADRRFIQTRHRRADDDLPAALAQSLRLCTALLCSGRPIHLVAPQICCAGRLAFERGQGSIHRILRASVIVEATAR